MWFVSLAPLSDPQLVLPTVAQTVGASGNLADDLRGRRTLLVLDNFEHLLDASGSLAELLAETDGVRILATSRAPLRIDAEQELPLEPLPDLDAAALFVERARAAGRRLEIDEAVVDVCRRVDCLPLAVELAAARAKLLDPAILLERLAQRLPLLAGGRRDAPERQRTLGDTIAWSYGLLGDDLQRVFRRLAVFAGDFSLEAVQAVCDATIDDLAGLVDASLLKSLGTGRLLMLETIREYGRDRLDDASEGGPVRAAHAVYFRDLAEEAEPHISLGGDAQSEWFRRLEEEHNNLRLALAFFRESGNAEDELRLAVASQEFLWLHGYVAEARFSIEHVLGDIPPEGSIGTKALEAAAYLAYLDHDQTGARQRTSQLLERARSVGDDLTAAKATHFFSLIAENDDERIALEQKTLELGGDDPFTRYANETLGVIAVARGDFRQAKQHLERSLEISRAIGERSTISGALVLLAYVAAAEGDHSSAAVMLREAVGVAREIGDVTMMMWGRCWTTLAATLAARGSTEHAVQVLAAAEFLREEAGVELAGYTLRLHERVKRQLWESIGEQVAAAVWEQGRSQASDEFLDQALRDLD